MCAVDKVQGAYSTVFIQYEGSLKKLSEIIENNLSLPEIRYENTEDEPYDMIGYCEALGFEIKIRSVRNCEKWPNYQYIFEAKTTDSLQEEFNNQMFDLLLWMARYISLICEVPTLAENQDKQTTQSFYFNQETLKRESHILKAKK